MQRGTLTQRFGTQCLTCKGLAPRVICFANAFAASFAAKSGEVSLSAIVLLEKFGFKCASVTVIDFKV